jgi:hypothetical protein
MYRNSFNKLIIIGNRNNCEFKEFILSKFDITEIRISNDIKYLHNYLKF